MEILYIDRIRLYLCLKAECLTFIIHMSVLTVLILHEVCRIELYAWTICKNIHLDTGFL